MKLILVIVAVVLFLLAAAGFFFPPMPSLHLVALGLALWAIATVVPPGTAAP